MYVLLLDSSFHPLLCATPDFVGCVFWDTTILLPFTDQVTIGGDVLVLGGVVNMVGCFFFSTVLFAEYMGAGFTITVLGGTVILTGTIITAQGILISAAGAGFVFMIGGESSILGHRLPYTYLNRFYEHNRLQQFVRCD
jgi:hypothetical protein